MMDIPTFNIAPGRRVAIALYHFVERLLDFSLVLIALLFWQWAATAAESMFFPPPLKILQTAYDLWLSGPPSEGFFTPLVFLDIVPSLARMLTGWLLAAIVGVALGFAIGRARNFADYVDPALQFLRAVPGPALIPIFLILLGTGTSMRITLIAFSSVWPVLLNTIEGVRTVDPGYLQSAAAFRLPKRALIFRVIIPAAMPKIVAGMRVSMAISLILMVISEMVAASSGIGFMVFESQMSFTYDHMWAGIGLLALTGFAFNMIFTAVEAKLLGWHRGATSGNK